MKRTTILAGFALAIAFPAFANVVRLDCPPWSHSCPPLPAKLPPCPALSPQATRGDQMRRLGMTACVSDDHRDPGPAAASGQAGKLPWNP